jgi:hypothetical protein
MTRWQEIENDIAYWIEQGWYAYVLDGLIAACQYWATAGNTPPPECDADRWGTRERALRHAQREGDI